MTGTSLRVGIAGLGRLGRRHATMLARQVAGAELVAACSPVAEETAWAREALGVPHTYVDYDALLAHPGLDAVFLVTPTSLHADQIVAALRAGKHVFSEKPTALDLDACRRVEAEAARHPRLKAMIGFVRRFDPHYRDAHAKILAGAIGRPFFARSQCADMNDPGGFFVRYAPQSGGIMLDMSVHDIDAARWMLGAGRATRVYATGTIAIHDGTRGRQRLRQRGGDRRVRGRRHRHDPGVADVRPRPRVDDRGDRYRRTDFDRREPAPQRASKSPTRTACATSARRRSTSGSKRRSCGSSPSSSTSSARTAPPPLTLADATEATRIGIALMESMRSRRAVDL